jgi:methanogenic corrinoid protein MtbC1
MTEENILLHELEKAVSQHDDTILLATIDTMLTQGLPAEDIRHALMRRLEHVRHRVMSNNASIPDLLLCLDTMTAGLKRLPPDQEKAGIPLVIGVVEGDPHDLGKNIISTIYRLYGYDVVDLGCNVPLQSFVESVLKNRAQVLALSAMMSTTMPAMQEIIRKVKGEASKTVVMVGGAPLDEHLARSFGADGYAESAVNVLEETDEAMYRILEGIPWLSSNQR